MCSCEQGTCPGNCPCGCAHTPPGSAAATLAAIAAAETEARECIAGLPAGAFVQTLRWASDRLRLCARDRVTLAWHAPTAPEYGPLCLAHDGPTGWPCGVAESVIAYWQGETP